MGIEKINNHIANNEINKAIEALKLKANDKDDLIVELLHCERVYKKINSEKRRNIISNQEFNLEESRIVDKLLNISKLVESKNDESALKLSAINKKRTVNYKKLLGTIGIVFIILTLIFFTINKIYNNKYSSNDIGVIKLVLF